jgi:flagellar motility protein MotE (MotC chaperone)
VEKLLSKSLLDNVISGRNIIGPLGVICSFLVISALTRLVVSVDTVLAQTAYESEQVQRLESVEIREEPTVQLCKSDQDLQRVLDALQERELEINDKETALKERFLEIEEAERRLFGIREESERAKSELEETIALANGAAEKDLSQLTAVYETMKAKDAAAHFEAMAPKFAAGFFARMKASSVAAILSHLSPEFAYAITVVLAGQNVNAGKLN